MLQEQPYTFKFCLIDTAWTVYAAICCPLAPLHYIAWEFEHISDESDDIPPPGICYPTWKRRSDAIKRHNRILAEKEAIENSKCSTYLKNKYPEIGQPKS
jgi:hypothetical protein